MSGDSVEEERLREHLAQRPDDPNALLDLAKLLNVAGRRDESEELLERAFQIKPAPIILKTLSAIQFEGGAMERCEATIEKLIALAPGIDASFYERLVKLKSNRGDMVGSENAARRARLAHPDNLDMLVLHADYVAPLDLRAACRLIADTLPAVAGRPIEESFLLDRLAHYRERLLRQEKALPPETCTSWQDALGWGDAEGFRHLKESLKREVSGKSARVTSFLNLASVLIADGDVEAAEALLGHVRRAKPGTYADAIHLARPELAGFETCDDRALRTGLPEAVDVVRAETSGAPRLFLSCDPSYFERFLLHFLDALDRQAAGTEIHIHLLDGDPDIWSRAAGALAAFQNIRCSLAAETVNAASRGQTYARNYYHAMRFVRLYQELARGRTPLWLMDVDVNLLRDPRGFIASLSGYDMALRAQACNLRPAHKFQACAVGVSPTDAGLTFARIVAAIIADTYRKDRLIWSLDQLALFSAAIHLWRHNRLPDALFLQPDTVCINQQTEGIFQFIAGIRKFATD